MKRTSEKAEMEYKAEGYKRHSYKERELIRHLFLGSRTTPRRGRYQDP